MNLGLLKSLKSAYSSLSPDEVRKMATRPLTIELVADSEEAYALMEAYFIPIKSSEFERQSGLLALHRATNPNRPGAADITIVEQGLLCPRNAFTFYASDPDRTVMEILAAKSELEIALARNFVGFRSLAIHGIISRVARENALFSLVTAMPNILPNLLELPWAIGEYATDSAFLTVNQIRMAFLIAAASGKSVGLGDQKVEILGIVASAFGWRALARELVGKIPLGGGLIPKAAISWAGTFVVGRGVEQIYLTGERIRREEHKMLYEKALVKGREVASSLLQSIRKPSAASASS